MQNRTQAYAKIAQATGSPRELEAQLLMRAAAKLQAIKDASSRQDGEVVSAVRYNRRLWLVFASSIGKPENPLPSEIKKNVANLANFIIKHSMKIESDSAHAQDRVGVLININREIAAGLRVQAA
jgi:flagellar biosynthesis activator protein FlaF